MAGKNVIDVTDATFQQEVIQKSHEKTVLVDFWAPWCGPCRMLGPTLEKLANEPNSNFTLAKVNTDQNQRYAQQFQVRGIPAVKAFRNGQLVDEFTGAQPEPMVRQFLARVAPPPVTGDLAKGEALFNAGKFREAAPILQAHLAKNGSDPTLSLKLGKAQLRNGNGCEAKTTLSAIPASTAYEDAQRLLTLATYLCDVARIPANGSEIDGLYKTAADYLKRGDYGAGMYNLLGVIHRDKTYRDGQPKEVMLGIFTLLGEQHDMTRAYRQQLASALW